MKRYLLSIIAVFFMLHTGAQKISYENAWGEQGVQVVTQDKKGVKLNYSIEKFYFEDLALDGLNYKSIKLPGVFLPNDAGAPDLPGTGKYIAIPRGASVSCRILASRTEVYQNVDVAPAPIVPLDTDDGGLIYEKDEKIYSQNAFYPENAVIVSEKGKFRGVDVVVIGITPFQYNPVSKELIVYRDISFKLNFEGGTGEIGEDRLRSRWWDPLIKSNLLNADILPEMDYTYEAANTESLDYEYLIICPDDPAYLQWADSIKNWRNLQGIRTGVVTTTEVGGNSVAAIESYVDNAYNSWNVPPSAVLLLGDYSTGSDGITSYMYSHPAGYPDFASDNRFADVNGDDLPDIVFARITANDATQLEIMITKFLDYEANPPTSAYFYDHPITALGWQTERWFQICSETIGGYLANVQGKSPVRINAVYSGNPSSDPWSTAPNTSSVLDYFGPNGLGYIPATPQELGGFSGGTATDVVNAINNGSVFMQHRDHGYYYGWGEPDFSTSSINSLTNVSNELPFVFSINCQTGAFHRSYESFAEKFHRHTYDGQNSGALGLIAATEVSYSFVNDTYVWGVFDNMFPDYMPDYGTEFPVDFAMPAFGNAAGKHFLYQSSWPYNTSSKQITYRLFHHLGDAFMSLYTEVPQSLTVIHDAQMQSNAGSFEVTADAGAFIALTVNGEIIGTATATGSAVSIPVPPQTSGEMMIVTVTKQNHYRYAAEVSISSGGVLADFSADQTELCAGGSLNYTDQSSGGVTSWIWSFPGGTPSSFSGETPPAVYYNTPGIYDASLTVSDGTSSDTETKTALIHVGSLTADFSATPTTLTAGNSVLFTDLSICNPDTWNWSFPGGVPASYSGQYPPAVFYDAPGNYAVSLEVSNAAGTDTESKSSYITVTDIQYCESHGDATQDWIQSFQLNDQTNVSGSSGIAGYQDFTTITFNLDAGASYALNCIPGFANNNKFEYWRIWIDYNHDGDFIDAGELVFSADKKRNAVTGNITMPAGLDISTRMRISMQRGGAAGSCEVFGIGEVEDYSIIISPPLPQAPIADFIANQANIATGASVQFSDLSQNGPTSWLWSFPGGTPSSATGQNPVITYSNAGTYDVSLTATNAIGSDTEVKTAYIVVSDNPPVQYCEPVAVDNAQDFINAVTLGGTSNNSGQGPSGYMFYSTPSFQFVPGQTYNVSLSPYDLKNRNFWRIWIDFNGDGDFDDSDETLLVANNKKGTYSSSIDIPAYASLDTRMRITMKTGGSPSSCEDNFGGEVEDYLVSFGGSDFAGTSDEQELNLQVFPNPASGSFFIRKNPGTKSIRVEVYSMNGLCVYKTDFEKDLMQIDLDIYGPGLFLIVGRDDQRVHTKRIFLK